MLDIVVLCGVWQFCEKFYYIERYNHMSSLSELLRKYKISSLEDQVIDLLNKIICYNQGAYIQYEFLTGEYHKNMKIAYNENSNNIAQTYNTFCNHVSKGLIEACLNNFKYLESYFALTKKSKHHIRICVKANRGTNVIDIIRNRKTPYATEYDISENTGFNYVYINGIYYLCNNVPKAYINGDYKNPRLNTNSTNYKESLINKIFADSLDLSWCKCWKNDNVISNEDEDEDEHKYCYKSTFIVPMTLKNNDLSIEFRELFDNKGSIDSRIIFGFLCFDHQNANYFDEVNDVKICYMVADILSLYFISAYIHTDRSSSFREIDGHIAINRNSQA